MFCGDYLRTKDGFKIHLLALEATLLEITIDSQSLVSFAQSRTTRPYQLGRVHYWPLSRGCKPFEEAVSYEE